MGSAPARGGLDRVERRDGSPERDIFSRAVGYTEFGEGEHVVVFARREFGHRHANVATDDAVAGTPTGGERAEAGIGEIGHEGLIVTLPEELYAGVKRGVVAGLDFEAHGKAEAGADAVEVVVCGQQRRAVDLDGFAEIDLHPFHRVRGGRQGAVVAAAGAGLAWTGGIALRRPFEAASDFGVGFAGLRAQRSLEGGECGGRITLFATEILEAGVAGVVAVVFPIGAVEGGENGLEAVVILLRDGIEFMIMALGAVDGETGKRADGVRDHVVAVEVSGDFPVGFGLGHFGVADEIPRTGGDETQRLDAVGGAGEEHVAGDLFLHETRVGFVGVEGAHDVVAVGPGVGAEFVFVVAVGVAVVDDIEPVARPTFAVAGGGE